MRPACAETTREIGATLGFEHVRVIHANDSKGAAGIARRPARTILAKDTSA